MYYIYTLHMQEILFERATLLEKALSNVDLQTIEIAMCKKDILHFFKHYVYTDKNSSLFNDDYPWVLPFIPFIFQEELIIEVRASIMEWTKPAHERQDYTNVFIEKSRQMGVSWIIMAIFVYGWLFHDHKYLVISQKEEDVDKIGDMKSLFEKARFIVRNLPVWMLPKWFDKASGTDFNKYKVIAKPDSTGAITWESANPQAGRWGTYHAVFMDEMAFMANATTINTSCASATPCRIFNSTPNWEWNEFYRMKQLTIERKDEYWNTLYPEIKWLRYHWTEHPIYCQYKWDQRWYNQRIQGMTRERIAQELDINYNASIEWRVYPNFKWETWTDIDYDPTLPMYVWIDNSHWGTDPHAVVLAQTEPKTHFIRIFDCISLNLDIPTMANFMAWVAKFNMNKSEFDFHVRYTTYNRSKATFISDPYDSNTNIVNIHNPTGIVIANEYRKVWINLNTPHIVDIKTRVMETKANIYRLKVHPRCADYISSMQNARYPEQKETSNRIKAVDTPIHDRTSHFRTCTEYGLAWILENETKKPQQVQQKSLVRRDKVTGKLIYTS